VSKGRERTRKGAASPAGQLGKDFLLSVVMPVYNEEATIREILRRVAAVPMRKEVVVVDDGSSDDTRRLLQEIERDGLPGRDQWGNDLRLVFQPVNQGKGAALQVGFAAASGDIVVVQDADLEYDPAEYPHLVGPILDGRADAVYGSRFLGAPHRVLFFWHMVGNKLLTTLSNMLTNLNLTDMETGAKAFRADVIKNIPLRSQRFGFEPEVTAKLARMRARIYEIGVSYSGRHYWQGKKIGLKDAVAALWTILRTGLTRDPAYHHPAYAAWHRLERMYRFNDWLWEQIQGWVGQRILCLSAGAMNVTQHLLTREHVVVTDADTWYLRLLRLTFGEGSRHVELRPLHLGEDGWYRLGEFDTVLCLDVLEQVEDDGRTLRSLAAALVSGGRLIVVVPALQKLHGTIDDAVGNLRRYGKEELRLRLEAAGFLVERMCYFNWLGAVAWYVNSRVLQRRSVPAVQAWLNDRMVWLLRMERRRGIPWGLSLLVVARKQEPVCGNATGAEKSDG
jgi:glycosyltransferase involved in cell wall biosynthesis